jgi:hypothetical protein
VKARLVLDSSEHAGMLKQIKEGDLALDGQHGIYCDGGGYYGGGWHRHW